MPEFDRMTGCAVLVVPVTCVPKFKEVTLSWPMPLPVEVPPEELVPEDPEPPPVPVSAVHAFTAVQPYRFAPAAAALLKKSWPTWQVAGSVVPTVMGRVKGKLEKSGFRPCVPRLMVVV